MRSVHIGRDTGREQPGAVFHSCLVNKEHASSRDASTKAPMYTLVRSRIFVVVFSCITYPSRALSDVPKITCHSTNERTLRFLELYRYEPVAWDLMHSIPQGYKKMNDARTTRIFDNRDSLTFRGDLRKKKMFQSNQELMIFISQYGLLMIV